MTLREVIAKYLQLVGGYDKPAPLEGFGLTHPETERLFGVFDEDYHISRFFHFSNTAGEAYQINGFPQTHVAVEADIQTIL